MARIFIGGQKKHHLDRIKQAFPNVEFTFASYDDPDTKWISRASRADIVVIDQSRCSHDVVDALRKRKCRIYFVDGKREIHELIERLIHGQAQPTYIATWLAI